MVEPAVLRGHGVTLEPLSLAHVDGLVAPAAKLLMLEHAFDNWKVLRVTLKTDARNERSRGAIVRLGATFEGIRRAHMLASDGTIRDSAYYSIVRDEWPAVRAGLVDRLRG